MTPGWLRDLGGADPYRLLGVPRDAGSGAVLRAHRARIRELHPDQATGDAAQARLVNLAREILLDPVRRAEYDRLAEQPSPTASHSSWDAADVVRAAGPPPAWESEDVVAGADPPPPASSWYDQPAYSWERDQPAYPAPPYLHIYYPRYSEPRPAPPPLGRSVAALVWAFLAPPVGFVLGIVALRRHRSVPWSPGYALAVAAATVGGILSVFLPFVVMALVSGS